VVARQTVTVGYMLQKSLQLDGAHMLELFTKLGALARAAAVGAAVCAWAALCSSVARCEHCQCEVVSVLTTQLGACFSGR